MRYSRSFTHTAHGIFVLAVLFLAVGWGGSGVRAAVIDVTPSNVAGNIAEDDTTTKNLQEIIDDSGTKSGDVIQFAAGTYTDVGELLVTKPLTFRKDPGASGDAVITGKFVFHIRSKDVKVEDLTFRNVIFPDRVTVEKRPTDPLTVGEEFGAYFNRDFSIDRFLLGRKAANSDDDATNDDRFTGADGLDYSGYEGGLARKDLAPFLKDGPENRPRGGSCVPVPVGGEFATGNLDWYQYNPTALVTDEDGAPISYDTNAKIGQWWNRTPPKTDYPDPAWNSATDPCGWESSSNPKWRFFTNRPMHPQRWLKDQFGVIMISSRYRHDRTTCPKGGEMTGIEVSRNEFDGTEVSAVVVNLHNESASVCEEEVSVVGNEFDNIGVVDSEYLRRGGDFITDGDGYRIREPRGSKYAISLRDTKTALVSDNVIRATTAWQIFVQGAPEGARIMIRNNLLEAPTTPGSRLLGYQIHVDTWDPETDPQADDVEVTIMNNRIIGTTIPYSTYHYRDFKRLLWEDERLCDLYPTLHTMPLARVEELIEPRIWRSYVPDFPYPDEDGSSSGVRIPLPPEAASPVPLVDLIKKRADGDVEPLTDDIVIGGWDIVRFKDCSRSARIFVKHQRNVRIVGNDLGYVASAAGTGRGRSRSVVADGHGEDSEGTGYLRFGVSLRGDAAKLREFSGNNIDYTGIRAVDVYDTEETVSAAGNFLGIRGAVSDGVSVEGKLGVPIVRAAGDVVGPRTEMRVPPMEPVLAGASADGAALTLTFSEELDGSSVPVASAFSVRGASSGGVTPVYTVGSVRVSGVEVRLTLTTPVAPGTTGVTVSYAKPASGNVLSAADGDEVDSFSGESVTVEGGAEPVSPTGPGADSAAGGGDGGCSLASAGGAGVVSAAFMLLLPLLFSLRRSGQ